jgi:hypothetical protein
MIPRRSQLAPEPFFRLVVTVTGLSEEIKKVDGWEVFVLHKKSLLFGYEIPKWKYLKSLASSKTPRCVT